MLLVAYLYNLSERQVEEVANFNLDRLTEPGFDV
jgi:hypothetical protein